MRIIILSFVILQCIGCASVKQPTEINSALMKHKKITISDEEGIFYLIKGQQRLCKIMSVDGLPKFISIEIAPKNINIVLLTYFAGSHDLIDILDNQN